MKCFAAGRIGKAPESRTLQSGKVLTRFSVAESTSEKDKDGNYKTEWTDFCAWDKTAEYIRDKVGSGDLVSVEAEKRTIKKDDKFFTNYIVRDFHMLKRNKPAEQTAAANNEPPAMTDEEIPF